MVQPKPTFRETVHGRFTDFVSPVLEGGKSGYIQNTTLFDGHGWLPEKCMHSDMVRTEYRMRYNKIKPFHKLVTETTSGKLPKKYTVYDHGF